MMVALSGTFCLESTLKWLVVLAVVVQTPLALLLLLQVMSCLRYELPYAFDQLLVRELTCRCSK